MRNMHFKRRASPAYPQWAYGARNVPIHRVVRRTHNWPIVMQESIDDAIETIFDFGIFRQHRFTADIRRRCHQWAVETVEQ